MASNEMIVIRIKLLNDLAKMPSRMSEHAAGYDIRAALEESFVLKAGKRELVKTGFAMEIPAGYEAQIRPRSGLAIKHGITCLNTPGTIDCDYRGEVMIILANLSDDDFIIEPGSRIAQMVINKLPLTEMVKVESLSSTDRGEGGFGSTGDK